MLREKLHNPLVSSFSYIMYNIYKRACIIFMETIKNDYSFYKFNGIVK